METDAIFIMASSTKPVLGVAAMIMIEEGLMSPSDPVSKYIPEFADMKVAAPVELASDNHSKCIALKDIAAEKAKDWLAATKYISASAGLSSTAEDFLHFEQILLNGGELFGHRLLSPASVEMMSSNQVGDLFATAGKRPKGMGFGYTVGITLDSKVAGNHCGNGAFGWMQLVRSHGQIPKTSWWAFICQLYRGVVGCLEVLKRLLSRRSLTNR